MKTAFCIVFLILLPVHASAQFSNKYNYKFKTYTMLDGLVHNFTKKCAEDSNGFLWIITQHGLSRFDGLNFKNFENVFNDTASLPANNLSDIAIDKTNRIWLSYNTGLCYYDQAAYRFHLIRQNNKIVKSSSVVYNKADNCVYSINYDGYTRINCADLSVHVFNFKEPLQVHYYEIGNGFIDSKQRLWIPCPRLGFYVIHIKTNEQVYFKKEIWPISFFEDNNHNTWITTWSEGLLKIAATATNYAYTVYSNAQPDDPLRRTQIQMEAAQCSTLTGDSILWLANETTGIMLFNKNTGRIVYNFYYNPDLKNGIATDFNSSIFSDRFGILWICSWHGLTKVNKQEQQFSSQEIPYLQSLHFYNRLSGIEDDPYNKNIAWLSAEGSGILSIDKSTGKVLNRYFFTTGVSKEPDGDINIEWRWVKYMFKDHENNIWATTLGGIIKIAGGIPEKIPLKEHKLQVSTLTGLEQPWNSLWFASSDGILNYNPVRNKYNLYKVNADADANYFSDMIVKNDSALLLAGNKGAFEFDMPTKTFRQLSWAFNDYDSIMQQQCSCLKKINNFLFIGTRAGLIKYNLSSAKAEMIGYAEGINSVLQNCMEVDADNNLWIYTSGGLFKYYVDKNSFQKFTTADGIYDLSNDIVSLFEYDHLFYIGYRFAFTSFDPLKVNINPVKSNPVITDVLVDNKPLNRDPASFSVSALHLSHKQKNIAFSYTSPDYTNTDKVTFAYQLHGYDTGWIQSGRKRTATYTNLTNGDYTFKVKACNSSGLWNNKPAVFFFHIATPFWKTWWFCTIAAMTFCFIVYKIYRYRINRMLTVYKIRDSISKNLHDEIGATLSSINIYSEVAKSKLEGNNDVKLLLQRIHDGSANVMENMSDIVWYVNPKNDSIENVIIKMREYAAPVLEAKQTNLVFDIDDDLKKIKLNMQQRQNFYLLFKEAINNIAKYASAKNVIVRVKIKENKICLLIKDDGKGFNVTDHKKGNGLVNMQQRATLLNGKCTIKSMEHAGTSVTINFPISL